MTVYYQVRDGEAVYPDRSTAAKRNGHVVAVIDPEDREQVQRLLSPLQGMSFAAHACGAFTCLQAALREYADPKPDEPTEPAARVEDRRNNIWRLLADGDWICTSGPDIGEYIAWPRLVAERGPVTIEDES